MGNLPDYQMECPECGGIAESDHVDVGVGIIVRGNYACQCGWEYEADGKMNVATYDDWFPDLEPVADIQELADWSCLPKDIYVVGAQLVNGIGHNVQCCSVPMVLAPEVRYTRAA